MTRLLALPVCLFCSLLVAPAAAQTYANPAAPSRYAQAQPMARPAAGPQQQPVRQVSDQQPVRQPVGPGAPAGANPQPIYPQAAGPAMVPLAPAITPQQPSWVPLDPAHEKWVSDILAIWEGHSSKIKTLSCKFIRWDFDPVFGPREPNTAKTIAKGEIKYAEPDKGLFKVSELMLYAPPAKPGEKATYVPQDASFGEHWVCNGKQIFEFDARNKRVIQRDLPPEMQGKAIADGPLPFLFGAKAETIKARYWIKGNENSGNGKYWLDAVPKSRQDAQNFKHVIIVLDEKKFMPELLRVYAPNYDPKTNPAYTTYQFSDHEVVDASSSKLNPAAFFAAINVFNRHFYEPATPSGWKKVIENAGGQAALGPMPGAVDPQATAPRPFSPLPK